MVRPMIVLGFSILWVALTAAHTSAQDAAAAKSQLHDGWEEIEYSPLTVPWKGKPRDLRVSLRNGTKDFTLCFSNGFRRGEDSQFIEPAQITAFLHYAGEKKVIAGKTEFKGWGWISFSSGPGYIRRLNYVFPWGRNVLKEAWVELRLPGQRYWLEVPYGFTRNPQERLSPAIAPGRPPAIG